MSSDAGASTTRTALLVAAGAALGGALACGAAFGFASYYVQRLERLYGRERG